MVSCGPEEMILLLKYCQKISSSLILHHNAYVITSLHLIMGHFIISHHHKKGECSTERYFESEREILTTFVTIYYYICSVLFLLLTLTVPDLQFKLYCKYVCLGRNMVYTWFSTTKGSGIHWGYWDITPVDKGALLSLLPSFWR